MNPQAISQDLLGLQARRILAVAARNTTLETWVKRLAGGGVAVTFFNHCRAPPPACVTQNISASLREMGVAASAMAWMVRDVLGRRAVGKISGADVTVLSAGTNGVAPESVAVFTLKH